jgi:hypothetical protein
MIVYIRRDGVGGHKMVVLMEYVIFLSHPKILHKSPLTRGWLQSRSSKVPNS